MNKKKLKKYFVDKKTWLYRIIELSLPFAVVYYYLVMIEVEEDNPIPGTLGIFFGTSLVFSVRWEEVIDRIKTYERKKKK